MPTPASWEFWPLVAIFLALLLNNRALFRAQSQLPDTAAGALAGARGLIFVVQYLAPIAIATLIFAEKRWGMPALLLAGGVLLMTATLGNGLVFRKLRQHLPAEFIRLQLLSLVLMQALLGLVLFSMRRAAVPPGV